MIVWGRIRYDEYSNRQSPHSVNIGIGMQGFHELGAEVRTYTHISDIYSSVTREDIVLDYIQPCDEIFYKFGKKPHLCDYPSVLTPFLGRKIWTDTMDAIARDEKLWSAGYFVKPIRTKIFTGRVITQIKDLIGCGAYNENLEVLVSEPLQIVSEWRVFILRDQVIDVRPYDSYGGKLTSWKYPYCAASIEDMVQAFTTWEERPISCSLDVCVTKDKGTLFLELNDAYGLSAYGLPPVLYAKMISARWSQILGRSDRYNL